MGIIESVQQYDLNIAPGAAQNIDVTGDRLQFLTADDPFAQIEIRPNYAQGNIVLRPGQGFRFSQQVNRWVVFNRGAVPLKGFLLIGSGDFFDQRISGDVNVIDGGKSRTLANQSYLGYGAVNASAGNYGRVQLWNPAGSGVRVIVKSVILGANANGVLVGLCATNTVIGGAQLAAQPKLLYGSTGKATVQADAVSSQPYSPVFMSVGAPQNAAAPFRLEEPIILVPGAGLCGWGITVNAGIGMSFEWYEEAQ